MRRLVFAAIAALMAASPARAGDITYALPNQPFYQNGANLSGTIVTNGTIGELDASDVLSWTVTIVPEGGSPGTFSSSDPGSSTQISEVIATQGNISIYGEEPSDFRFTSGLSDLEYDRQPGDFSYFGFLPDGLGWGTFFSYADDSGFVVATSVVPEPASLLSLATGLGLVACWLGLRRGCRR